jgi:ABC-type transporter Mla subunit MlaD
VGSVATATAAVATATVSTTTTATTTTSAATATGDQLSGALAACGSLGQQTRSIRRQSRQGNHTGQHQAKSCEPFHDFTSSQPAS